MRLVGAGLLLARRGEEKCFLDIVHTYCMYRMVRTQTFGLIMTYLLDAKYLSRLVRR